MTRLKGDRAARDSVYKRPTVPFIYTARESAMTTRSESLSLSLAVAPKIALSLLFTFFFLLFRSALFLFGSKLSRAWASIYIAAANWRARCFLFRGTICAELLCSRVRVPFPFGVSSFLEITSRLCGQSWFCGCVYILCIVRSTRCIF